MRKVLIATPSYDGKIDVWYANSLVSTILLGVQNDILFHPIYMSYDALVQRARNDLIGIAIENGYDDILWIDADMEWDPEKALELIQSKHDVLGLPVIKKSPNFESYNIKINPKDLVQDQTGFVKVESVGTGFLKMSRSAFTYLWDNSEPYIHNQQYRRWIFDVKIQDGDIISEDVLVCQKLLEGGFDIYVDPSSTCNHIGSMKFIGNFENFMQKVQESLAPKQEITKIEE
jgi:hypothetical protein